jgi:hypothetical protein
MSNNHQPVTIDNATGVITEQQLADQAAEQLFDNQDNAEKTTGVIASFVASYSKHKNSQPLEQWLNQQFAHYPDIWQSEAERQATAQQIITTIQQANQTKADLYAHLDKGKSRESWLARKIEQGASSAGVVNVGEYARSIDKALETATETMETMIFNKTKNAENILAEISNAPHLHGFIAEADLANQFNINATTAGSTLKAEVPSVTTLNSPDIVIKNATGKVVEKIQVKLYDPEKGLANLKQNIRSHDYSDTTLVVNKEHVAALREEFPDLKITSEYQLDGVKMEMGEYADYKKQQQQAQQEAEIKQYDWNDASRMEIAKGIGKQALIGAAFSAGFQGARILGRRVWNNLTGKENQTANEDMQEFFTSSIKSAANVGVQVAVSGALVVAVKSGWIKALAKNTPIGQIANIAYVAMENAKCLFKLAKGEMTGEETLDAMGNTTFCTVAGIAGVMAVGLLGLTGVGGFVGAVVGGIAGSAIAEPLYQGAKAIVKTAAKVIQSTYEGVKSVAKSVFNTVTFGLFA